MVTDKELLEKIKRKLETQIYTNSAFLLYALAIALWGWGMSQNRADFFVVGFVIWVIGFIIFLIGSFKK